MILPFVRELVADLKLSDPFDRVRRHLQAGSGAGAGAVAARRRIAGLTFTARALYLPFFVQALPERTPALLLVADNKAAEALHQAILAACELTGALDVASVVRLPAHDVLPFENLSPHPEIQETRAATLWKIASHSVRLVIAPVEAACLKLFHTEFYAALALRLKVGEEYLPEMLVDHLLSVGYTRVDVVEMPGQLTLRGGILDAYSPEADRPVRIDFFGDEIESIRKFDPETQRSSSSLDTALLLPLTEIPIDGAGAGSDQCAADARGLVRVDAATSWRPRGDADGRGDGLPRVGVFCAGGWRVEGRCWNCWGRRRACLPKSRR